MAMRFQDHCSAVHCPRSKANPVAYPGLMAMLARNKNETDCIIVSHVAPSFQILIACICDLYDGMST